MNTVTCITCHGTRRIVRRERERWGNSKTWCYTGRWVKRCYTCPRCDGTGTEPVNTPAQAA